MKQTPRHQPGWQTRAAVATLTAALFLSACGGAEPAAIPTATTYSATPTAGTQATATTNSEATGTAEARTVKADASGAERQYASMPPEQAQRHHQGSTADGDRCHQKVCRHHSNAEPAAPFKLELDPGVAPKTVNNFVYLAQSVFYERSTFHRCVAGLLGAWWRTHRQRIGCPGYQFEDEANGLIFDAPAFLPWQRRPNRTAAVFSRLVATF